MFDFLDNETKSMLFSLVVFTLLCLISIGLIIVMILLANAGDWKALLLFIFGLTAAVGFAWYLYSM